jgi:hypothetical protein
MDIGYFINVKYVNYYLLPAFLPGFLFSVSVLFYFK